LVIGDGAGAAPSTTTTGTGVVTALGVNTGTAGAFIVNGGALGTPASGTVTNLTGTASININGTVGATTPTTGVFTSVNTSGIITISIPGTGIPTNLAVNTTAGAANGMSIEARADESAGIRLVQTSTTYNTSPVNASDPPNIASAGTLVSARNGGVNIVGANGPVRTYSGGASIATTSVSSTGLAVTGTLSATGTLSGGTSGTAYSFSGSAPATSLTLDASGNLGIANTSMGQKLAVNGGIQTNGSAALGTGFGGGAVLSFESPITRMYFGDGTGYSFAFSKRASSATTDLVTITDSGNLGLGVTPSAYNSRGFDISSFVGLSQNSAGAATLAFNNFQNSAGNYIYKTTNPAAKYECGATGSGVHAWYNAASGTAGNPITFTQAMTLDASSRLLLGTTNAGSNQGMTIYNATQGELRLQNSTTGNTAADGFQVMVNGSNAYVFNRENAPLLFGTNDTERARIDSAGVFQAGTIQASGSAVGSFSASKWFIQSEDSTTTRAYYTGPDASTKGSWEIYAATSTGSAVLAGRFNASANFVAQNIGLGATIPTTSGTGITFPATQSASSDANTLDDYEEGTWTPNITVNPGTATTYTTSGTYTKTGRTVVVLGSILPTNGTFGAANDFGRLTGLPFTVGTELGAGSGVNASNLNNGHSVLVSYSTTVDIAFLSGSTSANQYSFVVTYFV